MNKKGFTLVEIIATIAILGVILLIAIPSYSSLQKKFKDEYYTKLDSTVLEAGKLYFKDYPNDMPTGLLDFSKVKYNQTGDDGNVLIKNKYLDKINLYNSDKKCTGNVFVVKDNDKYIYKNCMKCESDEGLEYKNYAEVKYIERGDASPIDNICYFDDEKTIKFTDYSEDDDIYIHVNSYSNSELREALAASRYIERHIKVDGDTKLVYRIREKDSEVYPEKISSINTKTLPEGSNKKEYKLKYTDDKTRTVIVFIYGAPSIGEVNNQIIEDNIVYIPKNKNIVLNRDGIDFHGSSFVRYEYLDFNGQWKALDENSSKIDNLVGKNVKFRIVGEKNEKSQYGRASDEYIVKRREVTVNLDANCVSGANGCGFGNGKTTSTAEVLYQGKYDNLPSLPPYSTNDHNYTFAGWFPSKSDGTQVDSDTTVNDPNPVTLYAHWTESDIDVPVNQVIVTDSHYSVVPTASSVFLKNGTTGGLYFNLIVNDSENKVQNVDITFPGESSVSCGIDVNPEFTSNFTQADYGVYKRYFCGGKHFTSLNTKTVTIKMTFKTITGSIATRSSTYTVDVVNPTCPTPTVSGGTANSNGWYNVSPITLRFSKTTGVYKMGWNTNQTKSEYDNPPPEAVSKFTLDGDYYINWGESTCTNCTHDLNSSETLPTRKYLLYLYDILGTRHDCSRQYKISTAKPKCTVSSSGTVGQNNWHISNVNISLTRTPTDSSGPSITDYGLTTSKTVTYNNSSSVTQSNETTGITWYGYVKDAAGNVGDCNSGTIKVDKTDPVITVSAKKGTWGNGSCTNTSTSYDSNTWKNYDCVNVTHNISDTNILTRTRTSTGFSSGYNENNANISATGTKHKKDEGSGVITYTATDESGRSATSTFKINLDRTGPTCTNVTATNAGSGLKKTGSNSSTNWSNKQVNLSAKCQETVGSKCTSTAAITNTYNSNSNGNSVTIGTIYDNAGNSTTCTSPVYIDQTLPTITLTGKKGTWDDSSCTSTSTNYSSGTWKNYDCVNVDHTITESNVDTMTRSTTGFSSGYSENNASISKTGTKHKRTEGTGVLNYRVVDKAGNEATASFTIKLDRTAPTMNAVNVSATNAQDSSIITVTKKTGTYSGLDDCSTRLCYELKKKNNNYNLIYTPSNDLCSDSLSGVSASNKKIRWVTKKSDGTNYVTSPYHYISTEGSHWTNIKDSNGYVNISKYNSDVEAKGYSPMIFENSNIGYVNYWRMCTDDAGNTAKAMFIRVSRKS